MTLVEADAQPTATDTAATQAVRPGGLAGLLGTADHIGLGRMWVAASLLFLLVAGVAGGLVGVERVDTADISVLDDTLGELLNMHATAGIFLFLIPAFLGIAMAVVPLQVGASTIAFPRAAAAAFWCWFLSGAVVIASYTQDLEGSDPDGRLLFAVGLAGVVVALVVASTCVVTTIWALRTAGMGLDRVPTFSWSMLVAGLVWLLSLPVLLAALVLTYLESQYDVGLDAGSLLRWSVSAPQVFAYALPALGLLLEAAPVAAGVRQRSRGVLLGAVGAFGVLATGVDNIVIGRDPGITQDFLYVVVAFALVLPLLAVAGGVADTLRKGRVNLTSPLLFGVVALVALLLAAVANAVRVVDNLDLVGTTADTSVAHLALAGGAVGVFGALHHWSTKLFGVTLGEGVGRAAAGLLLVGGAVLAVPDFVSGLLDQPAGVSTVPQIGLDDAVEPLNLVALVGGVVVLLGVLLVLVNIASGASRRSDEPVPDDPWGGRSGSGTGGQTLEWRTASPPIPGGPGPLEPVTSPEPLLDQEVGA